MPKVKDPKTNEVITIPSTHELVMVKRTSKRHKHVDDILFSTEDAAREQAVGFLNFLRENAIVGLAVGFIVGTQAQGVVKQLVASFIDPLIILLFGGAQLAERKVTLALGGNHADVAWGAMVYALINLLFVLIAIYALIKIFKLDKLDKPKQ
jgi:large-conductance mechanosensitive channel